MDCIFEQSKLTIVGACGHDANAGLVGLHNSDREEEGLVVEVSLSNSTQSTKNTVINALKSCCIQGAVLSAKRSSGARPRCGSVAPRRDYVI